MITLNAVQRLAQQSITMEVRDRFPARQAVKELLLKTGWNRILCVLVSFKDGGRKVSPRFHLSVFEQMLINSVNSEPFVKS